MAKVTSLTRSPSLRAWVRRPHRLSRATWLTLLVIGLAVWRGTRAATVPEFLTSLLLWALALAAAYWIVAMWGIVFSILAEPD